MKEGVFPIKRTIQLLTAAIFCLFLGGLGVLHILLPDQPFSPVENRNLSQLPTFTVQKLVDGSYTKALETYLEDQFPLRDRWIGLKSRYEYVLGQREFSGVYLCGDRLIAKVVESERAEKNLSFIPRLVEKSDIPVYLSLIPTAAEVWKDRLPAGAASFDQAAYLEKAKALGANWVDMAAALADHAGEEIFYRTDHHWTSLGAYYGYAAFMEAIGETPLPLGEKITVSEDFYGTLYSSSGVHWLSPDSIDRYVSDEGIIVTAFDGVQETTHGLYVDEFLGKKDKYASFLGGNQPLYTIQNPNAATDQKLLIVRDSYSDAMAPFLAQHFSEIRLLDLRYYRTGVAAYAQEMGADMILVCYSVDNFQKDMDAIFLGQ